MTCSEAQKRANLKWNSNNADYMKEFILNNNRAYTERNRELIYLRNRGRYLFRKECERFRNIFL